MGLVHLEASSLHPFNHHQISQKLPVKDFKWVKAKKLSKFSEDFKKNMLKIVIEDVFLKYILIIQKDYLIFIKIYHFYPKEKRLKKLKN